MAQLFSTMTVRENILMALSSREQVTWQVWKRLYQPQRDDEADDLLAQFGLDDVAQQPVNELSEGGLKLLDVALSLALKPRLLIMDEPTSGVSSEDKHAIMETLIHTVQATDTTLLFIEHDLEVVRQYAERVLVFVDGTIADSGAPDEVLSGDSLHQTIQKDGSNR
jgi:branched-chain amino acid transport system ATP-binding protein